MNNEITPKGVKYLTLKGQEATLSLEDALININSIIGWGIGEKYLFRLYSILIEDDKMWAKRLCQIQEESSTPPELKFRLERILEIMVAFVECEPTPEDYIQFASSVLPEVKKRMSPYLTPS